MSTIERFYTTSFTRKRMVWDNDSGGMGTGATFTGHIQQAGPEFVENVGEAWGKTFLVWCPLATDVQSGDSLEVSSGPYAGTYNTKNVQTNATGNNQHLELVVVKDVM